MTKQGNGITRKQVVENGECIGFAAAPGGGTYQFWRFGKLAFVEVCNENGFRTGWFGGKPSTIAKTYGIEF